MSEGYPGYRIAIRSIGCRTNQEEMASLGLSLEFEGHRIVEKVENAEIVIVNTCSVTSLTESKTRRILNAISSEAPDAKILVTGCLAQQMPAELCEMLNVHWVVGNLQKSQIPLILKNDKGGIFHSEFNGTDNLEIPHIHFDLEKSFRTRFSIKIQEGCDYRCAYCIVPSLRGNSRSVKKEMVIDSVKNALESGFKEIVLTGTHIGQYGKNDKTSLIEILKEILKLDHDFRIRLSSLDPRDLTSELMFLIEKDVRICNHLHMSVQSLSTDVLCRMNRPYKDLNRIIEMLADFRKYNPNAGIGGDFIVGFPGETEQMFNETLEGINRINFTYGHVFRYSVRPGTAAASFKDQVAERIKTERSERLRIEIEKSRKKFLNLQHGILQRIIVESEMPVRGLTSNYIHVEIPDSTFKRNYWLDVKMTGKANGRYQIAEIANL
jgi:threonylcarbamoyladenosine tRNA methylthiotransferase MtaB